MLTDPEASVWADGPSKVLCRAPQIKFWRRRHFFFYFFMFLLIVLPHKFFGTLHIIGFAILCGYTENFASIVCDESCNRCPQRLKEFVLACRFSNASHPNLQYLSRLHILKKT